MREILWSDPAIDDFDYNIEFLISKWTILEAQGFVDEVNRVMKILEIGNVDFPEIHYKNIRGVNICRQINLLYRINTHEDVELIRFWDARQNPDKLMDFLKSKY